MGVGVHTNSHWIGLDVTSETAAFFGCSQAPRCPGGGRGGTSQLLKLRVHQHHETPDATVVAGPHSEVHDTGPREGGAPRVAQGRPHIGGSKPGFHIGVGALALVGCTSLGRAPARAAKAPWKGTHARNANSRWGAMGRARQGADATLMQAICLQIPAISIRTRCVKH